MLSVDPLALRAAAARVGDVAARARLLDVATPLAVAGDALPGSATARACRWATTSLDASLTGWADRVDALATTADLVALDLAASDVEVGRTFRGAVP